MPHEARLPRRLSVTELQQRLEAGEPLALLDVREPLERSLCAIPVPATARDLFIPMGEIQERIDDLRARAADQPLVVYCHHGVRSFAVAQWLMRQGFDGVDNLDGGIDAWSTQVDRNVPRY